MTLLLGYSNSIVCLHYHLHFLRCLQRLQAQQKNFTCEKQNFSLNKKMYSNVEEKSPVCPLSDVNREQHNLCDYRHPLFSSSNIINCCATCFAQIEMLCYNVIIQRSCWATLILATKLRYIPKHLGKHSSKPTKLKMQFFYGLALTRIESKASLYSKGYTACKRTC